MYIYKSPIGLMKIYYDQNFKRYALIINEECYGTYHSAVAAADDVYCHVTGNYDWDKLDGTLLNVPTDIYEWESIK